MMNLVDPKGMWNWIRRTRHDSFNEEATAEAVKVWQLGLLFPNVEAGKLVSVVKGELEFDVLTEGGE